MWLIAVVEHKCVLGVLLLLLLLLLLSCCRIGTVFSTVVVRELSVCSHYSYKHHICVILGRW